MCNCLNIGCAIAANIGCAIAVDIGCAIALNIGCAIAVNIGCAIAVNIGCAIAITEDFTAICSTYRLCNCCLTRHEGVSIFFERDLRAQGALSRGIVGLSQNVHSRGVTLSGVSIHSHPSALAVHPNQLHCVAAHIERVLLCTVAAPNIEP
jgi:hypothetical protein